MYGFMRDLITFMCLIDVYKRQVLTALNSAIANPSLIECESEISAYSPTSDILRQQNEVNRMTDSPQVDFEKVKAEIFRLAEMKYERCTYLSLIHI